MKLSLCNYKKSYMLDNIKILYDIIYVCIYYTLRNMMSIERNAPQKSVGRDTAALAIVLPEELNLKV